MRHNFLKWAVISTLIIQTSGCGEPAQYSKPIDDLLTYCNKMDRFNGVFLAANRGQVLYTRSFGMANRELESPIGPNTIFDVGSSIKPLTATAVLILCERGQLSLETKLSSILAHFPYPAIEIRHLLSHTSGLPDYPHHPGFHAHIQARQEADSNHKVVNQDILDWLNGGQEPLITQPGESFEYCNLGYILLGMVIEKVTGSPFCDFIRNEILQPAEMNSSLMYDQLAKSAPEFRAVGYRMTTDRMSYTAVESAQWTGLLGDGGLYSTAGDMVRFLSAYFDGKFISDEMRTQALTPCRLSSGESAPYGYGWILRESGYENRPATVKHGGRWEGFLSAFVYEPETENAIVILTNDSMNPPTMREVEMAISHILNGREPDLPRFPIRDIVSQVLFTEGSNRALEVYAEMKSDYHYKFFFDEHQLNLLGYELMWEGKNQESLAILQFNQQEYPGSANVYDSLGDYYLAQRDTAMAIRQYQVALAIDSVHASTAAKLEELERR